MFDKLNKLFIIIFNVLLFLPAKVTKINNMCKLSF